MGKQLCTQITKQGLRLIGHLGPIASGLLVTLVNIESSIGTEVNRESVQLLETYKSLGSLVSNMH